MTENKPDDDLAEWDAAYVLGALNPNDQRTYENYLATNPERNAEFGELAGMPDILDVLSPEEALALTDLAGGPPTGDRRDNVTSFSTASAKRQRRSGRAIAVVVAAAAALAIVGGVVGATVFPRTTSVQTVAMSPMQPGSRPGLTAQLAVTEKKWGPSSTGPASTRRIGRARSTATTLSSRRRAAGRWSWVLGVLPETKPPDCRPRPAFRHRRSPRSIFG